MHSPNKPALDLGERVLHATLAEVRCHKFRRRRTLTAVSTLVLAAAFATWWITRPDIEPRRANPGIVFENPIGRPDAKGPAARVRVIIGRIPHRPLQMIERITASAPVSIRRIAPDPTVLQRIPKISDEELVESVPADQSVAVARYPGGSARVMVFD